MNEIEIAIDLIRKISNMTSSETCEKYVIEPYFYRDLFEAIEALQKQIPQKIKSADFDCKIYGCPTCDYSDTLWSLNKKDKYCPKCGQALDWSE